MNDEKPELWIGPGPLLVTPAESSPLHLDAGDSAELAPVAVSDLPPANDATTITRLKNPAPLGLVATLPITGTVLDAGQIVYDGVSALGRRATVGAAGDSRPGVLGLALRVSAGAGVAYILPDGQSSSERPGYSLGTTWQLFPLKRANVWLTTAAVTVDYLLIVADAHLDLR